MEAEERPAKAQRLSNDLDIKDSLSSAHPTAHLEEQTGIPDDRSAGQPATASAANAPLHQDVEQDVLAIAGTLQDEAGSSNPAPPLSKNQLKKLRRKQEWEAGREDRKEKRRERNKQQRQRQRTVKAEQMASGELSSVERKSRTRNVQLPVTFILDCDFEAFMSDKEKLSIASQVTRCYADMHKAPFHAHLALSSFGGGLKERFDTIIHGQYKRWKGVRTQSEDFAEVAEKARGWMKEDQSAKLAGALSGSTLGPEDGEIVYLTADAEETLEELKPYSTYIIGAIVDKNRHKGICYKKAKAVGIKTAKLPIGQYLQMSSRQVLTTNQVNEIMIRWLETGDWADAFIKAMPARKGGILKPGVSGEEYEDDNGSPELDGTKGDEIESESHISAPEDIMKSKSPATEEPSVGADDPTVGPGQADNGVQGPEQGS